MTASTSLADSAYDLLRSDILGGRLTSGTPLSVPALAARMQLSRSPVREAVQRLIHDGLATHVMHRGAEVVRLDPAELVEMYQVKAPLEGLAARLATTKMSAEDVRVLRALLAEQNDLLSDGADESSFIRSDMEFHRRIRHIAGNPTLTRTIGGFDSRTHLAFPNLWSDHAAATLSVNEHHTMLAALESGDPDEADRAAVRHAKCVRVRLARLHGIPLH
ncbi:GntR family transcriptional regulator [Actinomycetes bacterium M1A6_2h]